VPGAPASTRAGRTRFATPSTWFLINSGGRWLLAKLMGTSVDMIEQHYGHLLAPHANRSRDILDAIWNGFGRKLDAAPGAAYQTDPPIPLNHAASEEAL
jgi:hypothetical protein